MKTKFRYCVTWVCGHQYDERWYSRWSEASAQIKWALCAGYNVNIRAETDISS